MHLADIVAAERPVRELESRLFSALDPDDEGAPYDSRAAAYDRLVSSRWYSRIAWGVEPTRHTEFIARALTAGGDGWAVDVAAGSCISSAPAYARTARPLVILDRSLEMLRRGMQRLRSMNGSIPPHLVFLQADANRLPFRAHSIETLLCHGALHVFASPETVCAEWARVLQPRGRLFVSSLVRGRWLGDRYLGLLHRAGEVSQPRSPEECARLIAARFGLPVDAEAVGNFAYLSVTSGADLPQDPGVAADSP